MNVLHAIDSRGRLFALLVDFLKAYQDRTEALKGAPPIGGTSIAQKLDAIVDMLRSQAGVAADLALVKEELSTVHALIVDLATDPEKLNEAVLAVRAIREKLKTSVDNQTKGD